jgi:hypothetical protein
MEKWKTFLTCIFIIIMSFSSTPSFGAPMIKEMDIGLFTDAPSHIEATRYYLRYHAPEIVRLSGPWLRRYETYQAYDPPKEAIERFGAVAGRYSELWYRDFAAWRKAVMELPPKYTQPSWGGQCPFVIMTSTFLDVDPDYDFLKGGYTIP